MDVGTILTTLYLPVIIGDLIGTIILVPILVALEPVKRSWVASHSHRGTIT